MPAELGQHALAGGVKRNKERDVNQSGDTRFGLGQLLRARIRPMAGDSPSGYSLAGQSGLVFHVDSTECGHACAGQYLQSFFFCEKGAY